MKTQKDYQKLAARTSGANGKSYVPSAFGPFEPIPKDVIVRIETCSLGLIGELGEFADHIKKVVGHGHPLDHALCQKELGDISWYIAEAYSMFGLDAPDEDIDEAYTRLKKELEEGDAKYKEETGEEVDNLRAVCSILRKMSAAVGAVGGMIEGTMYGGAIFRFIKPHEYRKMVDMLGGMLMTVELRLGFTFREILELNVEKLRKRYPTGFSSEHSVNRKPEDV
jgi:NTP pyrophosphatase (non-canonical NTP hydrolase)